MKTRYEDAKWAIVVYAPDWEDDLAVETPDQDFTNYISGKAFYEWLKDIYEVEQKE